MNQADREQRSFAGRAAAVILRGVFPILVVLGGALGAAQLIRTGPQAKQRPPRQSATLVQTRVVQQAAEPVVIEAMGTVIAAKQIVLQPQVTGVIQALHPALVPGGRIDAGEQLVSIDPADYQVAVKQAEATLARAAAQLGSAELEWERVQALQARQATNKKELDDARAAQATAAADVAAAEAALEQAQIDLSRTVIRAAFSCVVTAENVDVGALVTPQTQLATLVGTDEYWVRATIPVERLRWIHIPAHDHERGAPVRIHQRLGTDVSASWHGHVVRLLGDLEPQGRMARLLVSVPHPLGAATTPDAPPPLLMGSYVEVKIQGLELNDVIAINRDELRDNDTVWVMSANDTLDIRPITVVFRGRDRVFARSGLATGERLVTSDLPSPITGMPLKIVRPDSGPSGLAATSAAEADGEGGSQ